MHGKLFLAGLFMRRLTGSKSGTGRLALWSPKGRGMSDCGACMTVLCTTLTDPSYYVLAWPMDQPCPAWFLPAVMVLV